MFDHFYQSTLHPEKWLAWYADIKLIGYEEEYCKPTVFADIRHKNARPYPAGIDSDSTLYRQNQTIETMFAHLKNWKGITMR